MGSRRGWVPVMAEGTSLQPWKTYDFRISELSKNTQNTENTSPFAKTHQPFVYATFSPVYMLEIRRSLVALIRLSAEEGKWEAAVVESSFTPLSAV